MHKTLYVKNLPRSAIAAEQLIEEVKKRPALYDARATRSTELSTRKALWGEITKHFFDSEWETYSEAEKEALVKEVQAKWRHLRDGWTRVKKQEKADLQKGGGSSIKRNYMFYNHLSFLEGATKRQRSPITTAAHSIEQEERNEDLSNLSLESQTFFKQDNDDMFEATPTSLQTPNEVNGGEETNSSLVQLLGQLVKILKDDKTDDRMGNKQFLLSLLPFMEKLPDDVNLEVRLQLMSILQTYSNGESFFKT